MVTYSYISDSNNVKVQRLDTGETHEFQNDPRTDQGGNLLFSIGDQVTNHLENILEVEHDYQLINELEGEK